MRFWRQAGNLDEANRQLLHEVVWPHFWVVQIWLIVLLFVFCSLRELSRALGSRQVRAMFFTTPPISAGPSGRAGV